MRRLPAPPSLFGFQRQLVIPLDADRLRAMSLLERRTALSHLILLLLEAAGVAAEERDDERR
jgi:hypothetical protein